jgi:hypothetical protein
MTPRFPNPDSFTDLELQAAGVKPRRNSTAGWIALSVLAALAVFVWAYAQWIDLQKARDFHAFESGLVRICAETKGVYTRGVCKQPDAVFQFQTPDILPRSRGIVGIAPEPIPGEIWRKL